MIFRNQIFTDKIFAQGDAFLLFYPVWDYRAAAFRAGQIPLWNPITFMGAPFLANSQYGVLYPLNWPLAWLAAPVAVKVSSLAHIVLAAVGTAVFARRVMRLSPVAAWTAAGLFALGGYLTARVEQINQLQGLAWLPWVLWAAAQLRERPRRYVPLLGVLLALQILAGHTQTFFITGVGLAAFLVVRGLQEYFASRRAAGASLAAPLGLAALAGVLGAGLAAAQLLPTLELAGQSVRAGGLPVNEAISFSLDPRLAGVALLPGFSRPLYSEYVATLGVAGLCLVVLGVMRLWAVATSERGTLLGVGALALLGLFFATGRYNPLYVVLVRYAPGFNLFRVPARWLALWAFGAALLAGLGLEGLLARRISARQAAACAAVVGGLVVAAWLATGLTPAGETGPLTAPSLIVFGWWLSALLTGMAAALFMPWSSARAGILIAVAAVELAGVSRLQPFHNLTTPAAYAERRPSVEYLLQDEGRAGPPGRVLAQSRLFYDPTEQGTPLPQSPAGAALPPDEAYRYVVAAKYQDVLSHNLALEWGIPTADGYDGGILPLRNYLLFTEYLLGREPLTRDGRLRESLDQFPADLPSGRALALANVRYLIADQTFDAWFQNVYFDLTHHARLSPGQSAEATAVPDYGARGLQVISFLDGAAALTDGTPVADITLTFEGGDTQTFTLRAGRETAEGDYAARNPAHQRAIIAGNYWPDQREINDYWASFEWPAVRHVTRIVARSRLSEGAVVIRGLTLVNAVDGSFQPLVISSSGRFRLALRSDVKVYDFLDVLPRAFVVGQARVAADDAAALAAMRAPDFDPAATVVLNAGDPIAQSEFEGNAAIVEYTPERVVIQTETSREGVLILSDAWYPGWRAMVDGGDAPLLRADLLFRAVRLPAGQHTVMMQYEPASWKAGLWISLAALVVTAGAFAWGSRLKRREFRLRAEPAAWE